jgi:hypothetical protein
MYMKLGLLVLSTLAALATGCAKIDVSPISNIPNPLNLLNRTTGAEVVSGASVAQRTLINRYIVDSSAGMAYSNITAKTPNGYKVYFGVKGAAISGATK